MIKLQKTIKVQTQNKMLCLLICIFVLTSLLPISAKAMSSRENMRGSDFTNGTLASRLDTIIQSGISGCVTPALPAVGGSYSKSTKYTTTYANESGSSTDSQCTAYARAAYSYLFGYNCASQSYRVDFSAAKAKQSFNYDQFKDWGVKCGAYLRTTNSSNGSFNSNVGHSLIILKYDSSGLFTLEGNYDGNGSVGILWYSWSDFNSEQLSGRSRYVCSFSQPKEEIYIGLGMNENSEPINNNPSFDMISDGTYHIEAYCGKVVEVADSNTGNKANVQIWDKSSRDLGCQKFNITKSGNYYTLTAVHSGKAIDIADGSPKSGTNIWQYTANGTNAQKWQFEDAGDGYYYIRSALGTYMDIKNGSAENGANVWAYKFNGSNAQKFKLVSIESNSVEEYEGLGFVDVAKALLNKSKTELGLTDDWCCKFVGYCINHSSLSDSLGTVNYNKIANPITLACWLCRDKGAGYLYSFSPSHSNRLMDSECRIPADRIINVSANDFTPEPGDIVFFSWSQYSWDKHVFSHVGIISEVDKTNKRITYIDGNSESDGGNYTYVKSHSKSYPNDVIWGYFRFGTKTQNTLSIKYNSNGGSIASNTYSATSSGMIQKGGSDVTAAWPYGYGHESGLYNASTFGLTREGYTFVGWSLSKDGSSRVFDQDDGTLKAETIYPELKNEDAMVTLFAIWKQDKPEHIHKLTYYAAAAPTCTLEGNAEYWYCVECGKFYSDSSAQIEITRSQIIRPVLGHNYVNGFCTRCGQADPNAKRNGIHFARIAAYSQGQYTDIPADQWFTDNVAYAFEIGLMNGNSATTFNPYGDVTLAEAITIASRIHSIYYTGTESFNQNSGGAWYQIYLDYAYRNGIINSGYYNTDVTVKATRAQFAEILSNSLPDEALVPMNSVSDNAIPDVKMTDACAKYVYRLYRAGILTGGDVNGTFSPLTYITRAEAATIISRMAESDHREAFML